MIKLTLITIITLQLVFINDCKRSRIFRPPTRPRLEYPESRSPTRDKQDFRKPSRRKPTLPPYRFVWHGPIRPVDMKNVKVVPPDDLIQIIDHKINDASTTKEKVKTDVYVS